MSKIYIGIDNGLDGGIAAILNTEFLDLIPMPTMDRYRDQSGDARKVSFLYVSMIFEKLLGFGQRFDILAVLEKPVGSKGYNAAISMADSFARTECALESCGIACQTIGAKTWQKEYWTKKKLKKGEKFDTKEEARNAAQLIWPNQNFLATPRSSVPHSGMVDAALIAEYARRKKL